MEQVEELKKILSPWVEKGLCVAFSGGVDSSLLLKIACDLGKQQNKKIMAVTFDTTLHPSGDLEIAQKVATELGAEHHVISVDERSQVDILNNPVDRCYRCKKYLFQSLQTYAEKHQVGHVIDGTNFDDLSAYRPGIQALKELNIASPLAELKITKKQVRQWADHYKITVSNRPSAPCLATRLPYNTKIDWDLLRRIELGEEYLKECGFLTCRIRVHGDVLRLELLPCDFSSFMLQYEKIMLKLKELDFIYITLDLEGFRSGSMDIHLLKGE